MRIYILIWYEALCVRVLKLLEDFFSPVVCQLVNKNCFFSIMKLLCCIRSRYMVKCWPFKLLRNFHIYIYLGKIFWYKQLIQLSKKALVCLYCGNVEMFCLCVRQINWECVVGLCWGPVWEAPSQRYFFLILPTMRLIHKRGQMLLNSGNLLNVGRESSDRTVVNLATSRDRLARGKLPPWAQGPIGCSGSRTRKFWSLMSKSQFFSLSDVFSFLKNALCKA